MANSSILVLPKFTAPTASNWLIIWASYGAIKFSSILEPQVVRQPLAQKISFCAIGMPVNGVILPAAICTSAAFACANVFASSKLI